MASYKFELNLRAKGVELYPVDDDLMEEVEGLNHTELNAIYPDIRDDDNFYDNTVIARQYVVNGGVDRFGFTITNEDTGEVVYETDDPEEFIDQFNTAYVRDDEDYPIEPREDVWRWQGVEDGTYLVRIQTIKGSFWEGYLELSDGEEFDINKVYIVGDSQINDEFIGISDTPFPTDQIFYKRGADYNVDDDRIDLDDAGFNEEQYFDTYLASCTEGDWWEDLTGEEME